MTSLAVCLAVDPRGPSAIYIITDSRITWGSPHLRWDCGQKTFASQSSPDIFGYCGDAYIASALLRQVLDQLERGLLFDVNASAATRHECIIEAFRRSLKLQTNLHTLQPFAIYHCGRNESKLQSTFHLWETRYYPSSGRLVDYVKIMESSTSYFVHIDGTGAGKVNKEKTKWDSTAAKNTSRAAISAFCDALESAEDPFSGGAPQLVGIQRIGHAKAFGFVWKGKKFVAGLEVPKDTIWSAVSWFNSNFEVCSGESGLRKADAKAHIRPF